MYNGLATWSFLLMFLSVPTSFAQQASLEPIAGRSTVYAPNGMVATSQPLATSAGLAVLQNGGNAVDAAITMAAMLSVVEPMMTGIGGDMFAILWLEEEQRLVGINASGRSGSLLSRETLRERGHQQMPSHGPETITVPGALQGWATLLEQYGTLTLAEALQPAIDLAEQGFPVSPMVAQLWHLAEERLAANEGARTTFLINEEHTPKVGAWFANPDYAHTLRLIAQHGPSLLYEGELGQRIVAYLQDHGGFLTTDDLAAHASAWIEPISVPYRGYQVWELPPNGQGIAVLEMLRILEPFDLTAMGHNSADYLHHLIEAKKLAFADLEHFVGDPDYMTASSDDLLTDTFIEARRALLDPQRATAHPEPGPALTNSETVYLATADAEGNMVSFINSVSDLFGSGVVVPGTGFALQNRGAGFTLEEDHPNTVAPGKRPFHTIIPAFVTRTVDGAMQPWLSFGVMGGSMQPQGHVQVLLNLIDFDMDPQQAVDAPRFRHQSGNRVAVETAVPEVVRERLAAIGHEVVGPESVFFGGAQLIMRLDRGWAGASEPRLDGMAAGH